MKVKITKCSYPNAWYQDRIGEVLKAEEIVAETQDSNGGFDMVIGVKDKTGRKESIYMKDCQVVEAYSPALAYSLLVGMIILSPILLVLWFIDYLVGGGKFS